VERNPDLVFVPFPAIHADTAPMHAGVDRLAIDCIARIGWPQEAGSRLTGGQLALRGQDNHGPLFFEVSLQLIPHPVGTASFGDDVAIANPAHARVRAAVSKVKDNPQPRER